MKNSGKIKKWTLILIVLGFSMSQTQVFAQSLIKNIKRGKAKTVETKIKMVTGELSIDNETNLLMEGEFKYKKDKWKPDISYEDDKDCGKLEVVTYDKRSKKDYDDDDNSDWNISLNKKIKQKLEIIIGAGQGNIDLSGSNLESIELNMAAGEVKVDLTNTSVSDINLNAIAGNAELDLSGSWENDMHAEIHGGVGDLTIYVPKNTGVKIEVRGILGNITAKGFNKNGKFYMNDSYEKTNETLYIYIFGGIGNVELKLK